MTIKLNESKKPTLFSGREIWIIKKLNLNSEDEIYCICGDYETYISQMQFLCDEDKDYIFDNDCIISPRGIKYKAYKTRYMEKAEHV